MPNVQVGEWDIIQSNGWKVIVDLQQGANGVLTGDADARPISGGGASMDGDIQDFSKVDGNFFQLRIEWSPNSLGNYQGFFGGDGSLAGTSHDEKNLASQATWVANRRFT